MNLIQPDLDSRNGASTISPGNLLQGFTTFIKKFFLISSLNLLSFSLKSHCNRPYQKAVLIFLINDFNYWKTAVRSSQTPTLPAHSHKRDASFLWLSPGFAPTCPHLSCAEDPELDAALQAECHESGIERQNHLPRPAGQDSFVTAWDMVGFQGCKCALFAHVQFLLHQSCQGLLCSIIHDLSRTKYICSEI